MGLQFGSTQGGLRLKPDGYESPRRVRALLGGGYAISNI